MSKISLARKVLLQRDANINAFAQETIAAQYMEMEAAVMALASTLREACPHVQAMHLAASDQGDWMLFDVAVCSVHVHPEQCPANAAALADPLQNYAAHVYTGHLSHLCSIVDTQVPRTLEHGGLLTLTMEQCATLRIERGMSPTTLHINMLDFPAAATLIEGVAELLNDGDCGSVWGESRLADCPPHVIINDPSPELIDALQALGIAFALTDRDDWAVENKRFRWSEPACPHTTD